MHSPNPTNPLHQACLGHLQHILELAMRTADAASAEGNHKVTLQAIREVTRIITLMTKMTAAAEPAANPKLAPIPAKTQPRAPQNSARGSQSADPGLDDVLQEMFSSLAQLSATTTTAAHRQLQTDNPLSQKWEKSGKLPGKTSILEGLAK